MSVGGLDILEKCKTILSRLQGTFSRREVGEVLLETSEMFKEDRSPIYRCYTQPIFIDGSLWPSLYFFFGFKVMPSMSSTVIDEEPPTGIITEWL
jgi:hypothetical protein